MPYIGHWQLQWMAVCSFRLFQLKMGAAVLSIHENRDSFKLSADTLKVGIQAPGN